MISEIEKTQYNGWKMLGLIILLTAVSIAGFVYGLNFNHNYSSAEIALLIFFTLFQSVLIVMCRGFFIVEPNQAAVLLLFGKYKGTEKESGFRWTNPLYTRKKCSLRARNFDSDKLKVNDKKGNPILISAVVVWCVSDAAKAVFEVNDYIEYVHIQSESALRYLATRYPYDTYEGNEESLRSSIDGVSEALKVKIQEHTLPAGVEIIEARINHLSYATEIAQAMLRRQQAEAIIAARQKIVDGSVGMVELALKRLEKDGVVALDEERKANMISNLMCVLCSEEATHPIINTGSLY